MKYDPFLDIYEPDDTINDLHKNNKILICQQSQKIHQKVQLLSHSTKLQLKPLWKIFNITNEYTRYMVSQRSQPFQQNIKDQIQKLKTFEFPSVKSTDTTYESLVASIKKQQNANIDGNLEANKVPKASNADKVSKTSNQSKKYVVISNGHTSNHLSRSQISKSLYSKVFCRAPIQMFQVYHPQEIIKQAIISQQAQQNPKVPIKSKNQTSFEPKNGLLHEAYKYQQLSVRQYQNKITQKIKNESQKANYQKLQERILNQNKNYQIPKYTKQQSPKYLMKTEQEYRKKILLGQTAVGKTSLLNFYFDTKFAIGMGDCTSQIYQVKQIKSIKIYDSNPLQTSQFSDYSLQEYQQYCKYDEIYFLYCTSLKNISKFIKRIVQSKNPSQKIYFIRTKCDNFDNKQSKTYKQQIQTDRNLLIKWGLKSDQIFIFGVSSKNKTMTSFDNQVVYNLLLK